MSLACLASAIGIVLTKKITGQTEESIITFYLGVASVICGLVGLFSLGSPGIPPAWEWFLAIGTSGVLISRSNIIVMDTQTSFTSRDSRDRRVEVMAAIAEATKVDGIACRKVSRWS